MQSLQGAGLWVRDTLTHEGRCQSREEPSSQRDADGGKEETGLLLPFQGGYLLFLFLSFLRQLFVSVLHGRYSSCSEWGCSWLRCPASHCRVFSCCGAQALGSGLSGVVHWPGCSVAGGIFPDRD